LQNALDFRNDNDEMDSLGREFYQRSVKTLIQVGLLKDKTYGVKTGLPLDIIPAANPYLLNDNDSLKVKIYFQQLPLAKALIKIWHRDEGKTEKNEFLTDENGELTFAVTTKGKWMVSTVKMERLINDPIAQWQSYWGSLTWGYE